MSIAIRINLQTTGTVFPYVWFVGGKEACQPKSGFQFNLGHHSQL